MKTLQKGTAGLTKTILIDVTRLPDFRIRHFKIQKRIIKVAE